MDTAPALTLWRARDLKTEYAIGNCTVRVFTMDSAVLGLAELGSDYCTVRAFRQKFTLEDAIEF